MTTDPQRIPRMPRIDTDAVEDHGLRNSLDHAAVTRTAHRLVRDDRVRTPRSRSRSRTWEVLHRGGLVPRQMKELGRIAIAQMIECDFCARQR